MRIKTAELVLASRSARPRAPGSQPAQWPLASRRSYSATTWLRRADDAPKPSSGERAVPIKFIKIGQTDRAGAKGDERPVRPAKEQTISTIPPREPWAAVSPARQWMESLLPFSSSQDVRPSVGYSARAREQQQRFDAAAGGSRGQGARPLEKWWQRYTQRPQAAALESHADESLVNQVSELSEHEARVFVEEAAKKEITPVMPAASPIGASAAAARTPAGARAILEELFPEEMKASRVQTRQDAPTLPKAAPSLAGQKITAKDDVAVVTMTNGSVHLTEDDFRRIIGTRHLENWSPEGDLLCIVRGREPHSMERNRDYYLLFSTAAAAESYVQRALRLHRESQPAHRVPRPTRQPDDVLLEIPTPPDIDAKTGLARFQTYTLMPPSHQLSMEVARPPYASPIKEIVAHMGYPEIAAGRQSDHEVLVWIPGKPAGGIDHLEPETLQAAIERDGVARAGPWSSVSVRKLVRPLASMRNKLKPLPPRGERLSTRQRRRLERMARGDVPEAEYQPVRQIFIASFGDGAEAARFAARWHRRNVASLLAAAGAKAQGSALPRADDAEEDVDAAENDDAIADIAAEVSRAGGDEPAAETSDDRDGRPLARPVMIAWAELV